MSERHPNGSETQEGPDWWLASDNRWYPPELHPEFRHARSVVIGESSVSALSDPNGADSAHSAQTNGLIIAADGDRSDTDDQLHTGDGLSTGDGFNTGDEHEHVVPGLLGVLPGAELDPEPEGAETVGAEPAGTEPSAPESTAPESNALEATEPSAIEPDAIEPTGSEVPVAEQAVSPEPASVSPSESSGASQIFGAGADPQASQPQSIQPQSSQPDEIAAVAGEPERPPINIGSGTAGPTSIDPTPDSIAPAGSVNENPDAVVNPWTLPVRGRYDTSDSYDGYSGDATSDPDGGVAAQAGHRIVLPGQLETDAAPQSIRPSGPTPVAKSLTFRPAEPTTVQAAVNVPVADDTPWYQRSVDGSAPSTTQAGHNTPNIYGGALSVAGGALAIVGSLMTWATETGPVLDGFLWARKVPGFASNGGWVLVCGLLMGVAGVLSIIGIKPTGVWSIMSVVSGGLVLAAVLYSYADIVGAASEDWRTFVSASTGIDAVTLKARGVGLRPAFGLWLSSIAGLLGCGAGIYFKRDF